MPTKDSLPTNITDSGRQAFVYPGEIPQASKMTAVRMYTSADTPAVTNDGYDSAGIGQNFFAGDFWNCTGDNSLYWCSDNSQGAAVWSNIFVGVYG